MGAGGGAAGRANSFPAGARATLDAGVDLAMATGDAPQAMADVQAEWLARLRKEKGVLIAARIAGPFVLSTRGRQSTK